MTPRTRQPNVFVWGIEGWPLQKLLDRMSEAALYNSLHGYLQVTDCPAAWGAYCDVLGREYLRRGEPVRLF